MPDFMNTTALFTFNGWALDGYFDVFWLKPDDQTVSQLLVKIAPELAVLIAMTIVFLGLARLFARRWETA
jgi:hypothetical protein